MWSRTGLRLRPSYQGNFPLGQRIVMAVAIASAPGLRVVAYNRRRMIPGRARVPLTKLNRESTSMPVAVGFLPLPGLRHTAPPLIDVGHALLRLTGGCGVAALSLPRRAPVCGAQREQLYGQGEKAA